MKHQIALCNPILQEISYSLVRKFDWAPARIEDALADYLDNVIHIEISNTLRGICRDPKDDMVIECAVEAGAEIIVSGDKDLLALDGCRSIRILTPREFLTQAQPG